MADWRKQQGQSHLQMGHWRPFSNRKPPLNMWRSTVPAWEKEFCASIGSVPWRRLVECKKYMYFYDNVVNWNDCAVKETFDNEKMRYWARINGIPCDLVLPDPDIYIDDVDWNATIDPELIMDLEKEEAKVFKEEEEEDEAEIVLVDGKLFRNQQYVPPSGWGDDEFEEPKPLDPTSGAQGWGSPLQQDGAPLHHANEYGVVDHARTYEWHDWRNDSWGWNRREHYGGGMGRGRSGRGTDGNAGTTSWDGYNRKRENISWSGTPHAYNGNGKYHHVNRRGRNYRGGHRGGRGRGNFVYVPKEMPSHGD